MYQDFSLDIMKWFNEDLAMVVLMLSQKMPLSDNDKEALQIQNLINDIIEDREFYHLSSDFNLSVELDLDENVYTIEILLRGDLDKEVRENIYSELEFINIEGHSKLTRNENFTELKIFYNN